MGPSVASAYGTVEALLHLEIVIQSNPIFTVKTQLTERSRITDKHSENHIKKHREH